MDSLFGEESLKMSFTRGNYIDRWLFLSVLSYFKWFSAVPSGGSDTNDAFGHGFSGSSSAFQSL